MISETRGVVDESTLEDADAVGVESDEGRSVVGGTELEFVFVRLVGTEGLVSDGIGVLGVVEVEKETIVDESIDDVAEGIRDRELVPVKVALPTDVTELDRLGTWAVELEFSNLDVAV